MDSKPPPWQEPPVFSLPGICSPAIPVLPRAYKVLVRGVEGNISPQLLDVDEHFPEFNFQERKLEFCYDPTTVVGMSTSEESICQVATDLLDFVQAGLEEEGTADPPSIMFFAYDIGGTLVKQALVTASLEPIYRSIFDQTSLVIFYGTPHRSSDSQTWAINGLRILHSCFRGLLGPWVPVYIEWMSNYQQRLNDRFRELASGFRVINVCQKSGLPNHELITDASCATVGLDTEVVILLQRSHYQLGVLQEHEQRENVMHILLDETIRHWQFYQMFIATLRIDQQKSLSIAKVEDKQSGHEALRLFLAEDSAQIWQDPSSSTSVIRLMLTDEIEFEDFYRSFSTHFLATDGGKANILLRLGHGYPCSPTATVQQLYASLCLQFLEQQPSLVQWVRHLYPNLRDAMLGVDDRWKSRALARCLRTILLVPKRRVAYCLVHYASDGSQKDVVDQILAVTQESEIPFRLLVSIPPGDEAGLSVLDTWPSVNLSSSSGGSGSGTVGMENLSENLSKDGPAGVGTRTLDCCEEATTSHIGLTPPADPGRLPRVLLLEQMLSWYIDNGMTWVLRALAWVSFAVRPLSRIEAEQALEVVFAEEGSIPVDLRRGGRVLHALYLALPGFLSITEDAVWTLPQVGPRLAALWVNHSDYSLSPELYLARTCFTLAATLFQDGPPAGTTYPETEAKAAAAVSRAAEPPSSNSPRTCQAIVEYAARYWIEHQIRGTRDTSNADEAFCQILETNTLFDRNAWIRYLISLSWSPDILERWKSKILPDMVQRTFGFSSTEACYISFRMATLPLTTEDDFDWLFLGIASACLPEDVYFSAILKVQETLSDTSRQLSTMQRAIAAAPDNLRSRIMAQLNSGDFLHKNFVEILLTAIAIGNSSAATKFLALASSDCTLRDRQKEGASVSSLGTALQVACEYSDRLIVEEILHTSGGLSPFSLEESYPWNALHVACHQGQLSLVSDIMKHHKLENWKHALNTNRASEFNPLLITSSRGLFALSKTIKPLVFTIPTDTDESTPLQLASKHGFLKTLDCLFDDYCHTLPLKSHDNHALFLALKSRNDQAATRVYAKYLENIEDTLDEYSEKISNDDDKSQCTTSGDDGDDDTREDNPFFAAEKTIEKALFMAVRCDRMQSTFQSILNNVLDPSITRDSEGRTPLMISAGMGVVECAEQLQGDELTDQHKQRALFYACAHGQLAIVELFLARGSSICLTEKVDDFSPMTIAAKNGHPKIVELLIPLLSNDDLKAEFILAARYGLERTMALILETAIDRDPTAREEFVNAKDHHSNTPLHSAVRFDNIREVQFLLLRGASLEIFDRRAMTPLAVATWVSSLGSMRLLLDAGASTETLVRRRRSILTDAIWDENEAAARLLLQYGAKTRLPDLWSDQYSSFLEFTMVQSSDNMFKVLLRHFDKKRKQASEDSFPAEIPTPTEALCLVIKHGAPSSFDVLLQVWDEFEPVIREDGLDIGSMLKYASLCGTIQMLHRVWEFLEEQTGVNEAGGFYGTALQAAICSQQDPVEKVNALIGWGAELVPESLTFTPSGSSVALSSNALHGAWGTALHAAAFSANEDLVDIVLSQQSALKDQPDIMGRLPLHLAPVKGDWKSAEKLLSEKSALMTSEDFQGRNVLHIACGVGSVRFVREVLENEKPTNLFINKTDVDGWTPLHWACRSMSFQLVEMLIEAGARITDKTIYPEGWLPYHVALYHDWPAQYLTKLRVPDDDSGDDGGHLPTEAGEPTNGDCDCCYCHIFGSRYKCTSGHAACAPFDLCFKCFKHKEHIHYPDHEFEVCGPY